MPLTDKPNRSAAPYAALSAKKAGALISATLKTTALEALRLADMNVSEEEMELLTGCKRLEDGIAALTRHATTPVLVTPKDAYC